LAGHLTSADSNLPQLKVGKQWGRRLFYGQVAINSALLLHVVTYALILLHGVTNQRKDAGGFLVDPRRL
jgi:hypothetical protein